jgi:tetratricopeptide (TPR) repeat protein
MHMPTRSSAAECLSEGNNQGIEALQSLWLRLTEAFLAHARETATLINDVITQHPGHAHGHLLKGYMLLLLGRAELVAPARTCLETGRTCMEEGDVAARLYAQGLAAWLDGNPRGAIHAMERVIDNHPRDVLAIKLSHGIRFILGDIDGMRRSLSRVISVYTDDVPFAGYIRGCYAFALEETGAFHEAEMMGHHAVMLAPRDAWGRHAVAHVLEMTGRAREGVNWLGGQSSTWAHCGNFSYHMYWHLALFRLELGQTRETLALYDEAIRAEQTDDYRDIANAASLLERLTLAGVDVGTRWEELADIAARRTDDRRLVFADLHYMLALLGARRMTDVEKLVQSLISGHEASHDGGVAAEVGVALAAALLAFQGGRYGEVVRLMRPVRSRIRIIGGSHAQRDVFEQIYLEALVRSGDVAAAGGALKARIDQRGGHNRFAAQRLAMVAGGSSKDGLAAGLVMLTPAAISH